MFMWRQYDRDTVKDDLAAISDLGLSCVRIFLLWEDFQPAPRVVSTTMLDRFVDFLQIATDRGLKVTPTLFAGHVSGLNWLPPWMLLASSGEGHFPVFSHDKVRLNKSKNPFIDSEVVEAQIFFLREMASAVAGHPSLLGWDLGSDLFCWALPPDESAAKLWLQAMSETLRERDENVPITLGIGVQDLQNHLKLTIRVAARHLDHLSINVRPSDISWAEGPLNTGVLSFVGCITEWLTKKPVLIQEFGAPTIPTLPDPPSRRIRKAARASLLSEDEAAEFAEKALAELCRFNMMGAFWKSYGDYHPTIWNWPALDKNIQERFYGLLRHDGSPKPIATAFKSAKTRRTETEISLDWLDTPENDLYRDPKQYLARLCRRFREYYEIR